MIRNKEEMKKISQENLNGNNKNHKALSILFIVSHVGYLRHYADTIRLLSERGHSIWIGINEGEDALKRLHVTQADSLNRMVHGMEMADERIRIGQAPTPTGFWKYTAEVIRKSVDFVRFLDPFFDDSPKLKKRSAGHISVFIRMILTSLVRGGRKEDKVKKNLEILIKLDESIPCSKNVTDYVQSVHPDILVISPLIEFGSCQVDYVKAALLQRIPCALCVASWDNLTNKGHIRIVPSRVILWNHFQKEEAVRLHGVRPDRILITGAQTFDEWFSHTPFSSRGDFLRKMSLKADKPYILYLCSSSFITPQEVGFIQRWIAAIRSSEDEYIREMGILIRPHPMHSRQWIGVNFNGKENISIWPRSGEIPVDEESKADFFDSIFHSAAVMGINTSGMIEAGIIGRPVFSIHVPEFHESQMGTIHFQYLVNGGLLHISADFSEHLSQMSAVFKQTDPIQKRNIEFIKEFIRPRGIENPCVPFLADAIEGIRNSLPEDDYPARRNKLLRLCLFPFALMVTPWYIFKTNTIVFIKRFKRNRVKGALRR